MKHIFYSTFAFIFIVLGMFAFSATTTHAYFTTSQKVVPLEDGASLFLITYKFGTEKHELQLPIMATSSSIKATNTVAYTIVDKDGHEVPGKSSAIALSSAKIGTNKMYSIPKNKSESSLLVVVFTPTDRSTKNDHRLQVTHLPFNFDGKQELQLNPSELKYYTTPYTDL